MIALAEHCGTRRQGRDCGKRTTRAASARTACIHSVGSTRHQPPKAGREVPADHGVVSGRTWKAHRAVPPRWAGREVPADHGVGNGKTWKAFCAEPPRWAGREVPADHGVVAGVTAGHVFAADCDFCVDDGGRWCANFEDMERGRRKGARVACFGEWQIVGR